MSNAVIDQSGWRPPSLDSEPVPEPVSAADAKATLEAAKKTGFDQGYAEGLAAGRIRGQQLAQALEELIKSMAAPFAESDAALVKELLELTRRVASAVIYRELENDNESVQIALRGALDVLGDARYQIELRVHPEDAALCRQYGGLAQDSLVILEDPRMHRGGLELKSGSSLIDATVEARLSQVMSQLYAEAGLPEPEVAPNTDRPVSGSADRFKSSLGGEDDLSEDDLNAEQPISQSLGEETLAEQGAQHPDPPPPDSPTPLEGELLSAEEHPDADTESINPVATGAGMDEPNDDRESD